MTYSRPVGGRVAGITGFLYGGCQAIILNIMFACTKHGLRLRVEIPEEDYVDRFAYSPEENVPTAIEKEKMEKEKLIILTEAAQVQLKKTIEGQPDYYVIAGSASGLRCTSLK